MKSPVTADDPHEAPMRAAIVAAERARGSTGDNPWVGCVIVDALGEIVASGYTHGPGEDHAEIGAMHEARARGIDFARATLYSTLEPCSFHGRTRACAGAIVDAGVRRVILGIRDPNPRVDGIGARILREAQIDVIEDVCARAITHQLAEWIFRCHPHEPLRRARALIASLGPNGRTSAARIEIAARLGDHYGIAAGKAEELTARAFDDVPGSPSTS